MKVLAINGSPRGKAGCTHQMLMPLLEGMKQAGAETEVIYLSECNIKHCIGCFSCWTKTPGVCIHKDDMVQLLEKIKNADFIVYGNPLYFYTMTGMMKDCFDRHLPLALPFMEEDKAHGSRTTHPSRYDDKKQKVFLVSPAGFPEMEHFDALLQTFHRIFPGDSNAEYLGEILRPAAGMMFVEPFKDKMKKYTKDLMAAGKQLIVQEKIDESLMNDLNEPWISPEDFRGFANKKFQAMIDEGKKV